MGIKIIKPTPVFYYLTLALSLIGAAVLGYLKDIPSLFIEIFSILGGQSLIAMSSSINTRNLLNTTKAEDNSKKSDTSKNSIINEPDEKKLLDVRLRSSSKFRFLIVEDDDFLQIRIVEN
ncbi:MAG: hypothetical protein JPMHGGIA_02832 [Saprospiraceae bacterium]|nr:hypothetical protein [Saprospiraceae bacterium]